MALVLASTALAGGQVGDPPSLGPPSCDRYLRPCTDAIILASGEYGNTTVEIWGMGTRRGLCDGVDVSRKRSASRSYGCGGHGRPEKGLPLKIRSFQSKGSDSGSTQIYGTVRSDVAGVTIRYRQDRTTKHSATIFNQVDKTLAARIDEKPFGVFEATVEGCVPPQRFRAVAFDAQGSVVYVDRGSSAFSKSFCRGGGASLGVGRVSRTTAR